MNKTMMWVIGAVILVVVGGGLLMSSQQPKQSEDTKMIDDKDVMMQKDSSTDSGQKAVMEKTTDMQKSSDRYVEYSKELLEGSASNRRVLFFYASWCPSCKPSDADLKANSSKIPQDVTVIRVNYNDPETDQEEKNLAKKYGITYQHTFVQIDGQGKEVTKWNGGKITELLANIK